MLLAVLRPNKLVMVWCQATASLLGDLNDSPIRACSKSLGGLENLLIYALRLVNAHTIHSIPMSTHGHCHRLGWVFC